MVSRQIRCREGEAAALRELMLLLQRAERDLTVAFSMFAKSHGLPDGSSLASVEADTVTVQVPDDG